MKKNPLKASPQTIKNNIERLFGTIVNAYAETGITRPCWYRSIRLGEISDGIAGRLFKIGINPGELVKKTPA